MVQVLIVTAIACLVSCRRSHPLAPPQQSDTIRVERGDFVSGVDDTGIVRAARSSAVSTTTQGQIVRMMPEGSVVRKGQPVLWLDTQSITQQIEAETINLRRYQSNYERTLEALAEERFNLEQTLKERKANHEFDYLNMERAERELELRKDRFNRQLVAESDVLLAEDKLEQHRLTEISSRLALERAELEYVSRIETMELEMEIAKQNFEQSKYTMTQLEAQRDALVLYSPADGIVVVQRQWNNEPYKVGDRVWRGRQILEIPDLSEFMVLTQVPEAHFQRVYEGQSVWIRIPALEHAVIEGVVDSISFLAMPRELSRGTTFSRQESVDTRGKVFEVAVRLKHHDKRLRTGMNCAVVFVEERFPDVLTVPLSAIGRDDSGPYVFVLRNGRFEYQQIVIGPDNRVDAVVEEGLEAGTRVALYALSADDASTSGNAFRIMEPQ
jgi:HlyD family secretion protein